MQTIPQTQTAIQLTGPDKLELNTTKSVPSPGPYQILAMVEAVGLCFSDLKLLKQFDKHARKSNVLSGIDPEILNEIPSYVPGNTPAVPGHEASVRIVAVGEKVKSVKTGQRYLVQTDYRWLPTANSNASFGYNFEGALQQYVLMDERVITSPAGVSLLIPASEKLSAAAVALIEPWACVEDAYAEKQRQKIKPNANMAIVTETDVPEQTIRRFLENYGKPTHLTIVSNCLNGKDLGVEIKIAESIVTLPDASFDDIIYFGSDPNTIEQLFPKVAAGGLLNICLSGGSIKRNINCQIGRTHYGGIRIIGSTGTDPAEAMRNIPETGEIKDGDIINILGAAGPMGVMHVIRDICSGKKNIKVLAGDLDRNRLNLLDNIAKPLADKNNCDYCSYDPAENNLVQNSTYSVIMVPVPALVNQAIAESAENAIINVFAGIAADVTASVDLDTYIRKNLYFIGTSGSTVDDMKCVLEKVQSNQLDTNLSVAAICSLDGVIDGIKAVENRTIAGKIVCLPQCNGLGLIELDRLKDKSEQLANDLQQGIWNKNAEKSLLRIY